METNVENILNTVVGSYSIPFVLTPQKYFKGKLHVDGDSAYNLDVVSAIDR